MSTIFISLPSLRDPEIYKTVESLYDNAKYPNDVYVGLHYQYATLEEKEYAENYFKKYKNIRIKMSDVRETLGLSGGRNGAKSLYINEDYILQIDSHTKFEKKWDVNLIKIFKDATEYVKSEKIILTAYLNEYHYKKKNKRAIIYSTRPSWTYMTNDSLILEYLPVWRNFYGDLEEEFLPARKFAANFVFTLGKYQEDLTLDKDVAFWSEEYSQSLNLIEKGYALVHPNKEIGLTHLYGNNMNHNGGQRLSLEHYLGSDQKEYWKKESEYIMKKIESHPIKDIYESYAGIKFGKQMCKNKFYIPTTFFPLNKV